MNTIDPTQKNSSNSSKFSRYSGYQYFAERMGDRPLLLFVLVLLPGIMLSILVVELYDEVGPPDLSIKTEMYRLIILGSFAAIFRATMLSTRYPLKGQKALVIGVCSGIQAGCAVYEF